MQNETNSAAVIEAEEQTSPSVSVAVQQTRPQEAEKYTRTQEAEEQTGTQEAEKQTRTQEAEKQTRMQEAEEQTRTQEAEKYTRTQEAEEQTGTQEAEKQTRTQEAEKQTRMQEAEEQTQTQEAEKQTPPQEAEKQTRTQEAEEQTRTQEAEEQTQTQEAEKQTPTQEAEEQTRTQEAEKQTRMQEAEEQTQTQEAEKQTRTQEAEKQTRTQAAEKQTRTQEAEKQSTRSGDIPQEQQEMKYSKMKGFATTAGPNYEIKLAALLYLRAVNSGLDFRLASNAQDAGALDDVIFKVKSAQSSNSEWQTYFIQLKHKQINAPYIRKEVFLTEKGDFSLSKYLDSYVKIKDRMSPDSQEPLFQGSLESCHFVIYTNASVHNKLKKITRGVISHPMDDLVRSGAGSEFVFSFTEDVDKDKSSILSQEKKDDAKRFLERLKMFTGEPSEKDLDDLIKREICKNPTFKLMNIDADSCFRIILEAFKTWWQDKDDILHEGSSILLEAFQQILSLQQAKEFRLDVKFQESSTEGLKSACAEKIPIVNIVVEDTVRVTCTKLMQVLDVQNESYFFVGSRRLRDHPDAVISSWSHGKRNRLVVVSEDCSIKSEVCAEIRKALENPEKQLLLVQQKEGRFHELIGSAFKNFEDNFLMSNLVEESRISLFKKEINFQGIAMKLGSLLNENMIDSMSKEVKGLYESVITLKDIKIGNKLEEDISYYVPRTLVQKIIVKNTIFSDVSYGGRITIHGATIKDIYKIITNKTPSSRCDFGSNGKTDLMFNDRKVATGLGKYQEGDDIFKDNIFKGFQETNEGVVFANPISAESFEKKKSNVHINKSLNDNHFLHLRNDKLVWNKSEGDIGFIKRHLDETVTDIQTADDRFVLLIAEPGMGKSTYLTHLAQQLKHTDSSKWIVCIALSNLTCLFAKTKVEDMKAEDFLTTALNIDKLSPLEQALFKYSLNCSGDIAILMDGFDEIAPKYSDKCCALISSLNKTKTRNVCITSRYNMKETLETTFSTLALTIRKFNTDDQRQFLMEYWKEETEQSTETIEFIYDFITTLLNETSTSMNDEDVAMTGIPLQTLMLAEIYQDHVRNRKQLLVQKYNVLDLIEQFVEKKLVLYLQKTFKINEDNPEFENILDLHRNAFTEKHEVAALYLLYGETDILIIQQHKFKSDLQTIIDDINAGKERKGILNRVVAGKPEFLHRVFAEYFAAFWYSRNYSENRGFIEEHLLGNSLGFSLLNRILARDHVLHSAVLNVDLLEVRRLLEEVEVDEKDKGGRTALHLAVMSGLNIDTQFKSNAAIIEELLNHGASVDMHDDVLQWTPVQYADGTKLWVEMDTILKHGSVDLTQLTKTNKSIHDQDSNGETLLMTNASLGLTRVVQVLLDWFPDDTARLMYIETKDNLGLTALLHAAGKGHLDVVNMLVKLCASTSLTSNNGNNALMIASRKGHLAVVKKLLDFLPSDIARTNYVNTHTSEHGNTALILAAYCGNVHVAEVLIKSGADLTVEDNDGDNVLMNASYEGHPDFVNMLLATFSSDIARMDYVNTRTSEEGNTALLRAARSGNIDVVRALIASGAEVTCRNNHNSTALTTAAEFGHISVVRTLLDWFKDDCLRTEYINLYDNDGDSALYAAKLKGHLEIVELLISSGADITLQEKVVLHM